MNGKVWLTLQVLAANCAVASNGRRRKLLLEPPITCQDRERIQGEKVECMHAKLVVKVFKQLIELWILTSASAWCAGCRAGPRSRGLFAQILYNTGPYYFCIFLDSDTPPKCASWKRQRWMRNCRTRIRGLSCPRHHGKAAAAPRTLGSCWLSVLSFSKNFAALRINRALSSGRVVLLSYSPVHPGECVFM